MSSSPLLALHGAMRTGLALVLLALAVPANGQRKVDERFAAAADVHVSILNVAGSVKVMAWEHDSVAVIGTVRETAAQRFVVQRSDAGVKIGMWDPTAEHMPPSEVEVRVPLRAQVWVRTGSASVFVSGLRGGIDANSVGGDIEIRGSPREAFAESMTGTIVLDVRTALARARTVTAPIRVHGAVTDLTATSVGGSILIDNAEIERASCETVDGEIRFVGRLLPRSALSFVTHAGAVEFLLPASSSGAFRIATWEGGFVNEFKTEVRTTRSKIKGSEQSFTLGGGSAQVAVRTFRGRVVVRSR
jgi:hypothetical protein